MNQKRLQAAFYRAASGSEPARDWLLDLPEAERRVVGYDIATVEFGWPVGMPTCRAMGQGLYEIRSTLPGNRISRMFFCIADAQLILLHGFIKKTQATPKTDLDIARKRMKDVSP